MIEKIFSNKPLSYCKGGYYIVQDSQIYTLEEDIKNKNCENLKNHIANIKKQPYIPLRDIPTDVLRYCGICGSKEGEFTPLVIYNSGNR